MKAATFPESWRSNPFLELLESHMADLGVEYQKVGSDYLSARWIWRNRSKIEILHFHWLQYHYLRNNAIASWIALLKFCLQILFAKICGYRIVWTAHNIRPHEQPYRFLDQAGFYLFSLLANSIVTLCENTRSLIREKFHRSERVFCGYHGNYLDIYPNHISRIEAKERLGVTAYFPVFLFFGSIRHYKGLYELIDAFQRIENRQACLIIAGKANDLDLAQKITVRSGADPRIRLFLDWISVEDVQIYFNACDFVVLPFVDVTTSGSALLGLGFGCPVIAPAIGCLPEVITFENGVLFDAASPGSLGVALQRCQNLDPVEMGKQARQTAMRFSWEDLARLTLKAYLAS